MEVCWLKCVHPPENGIYGLNGCDLICVLNSQIWSWIGIKASKGKLKLFRNRSSHPHYIRTSHQSRPNPSFAHWIIWVTITHNTSFTLLGYRRRYYWLLARPRCPSSELPSWSQCAMSSLRARTLHSPRSRARSTLRQSCVLSPCASCSRSKCQQPGDKIRARNRCGSSEDTRPLSVFSAAHILNWIKSEYLGLLNWTDLFRIDGNDLGVYSEGESFPPYTNLFSSNVSKYFLNIIPISCTINYKSCKSRAHKIYFL